MNEEEFLKRLHEAFALEADEHFNAIRRGLADLEQGNAPDLSGIVELIFREAHSLKGAARAVNRADIESLCQQFESLFAKWKKDASTVQHAPFDVCSDACDLLGEMLDRSEETSISTDPLASLLERLKSAAASKGEGMPLAGAVSADVSGPIPSPEPPAFPDSIHPSASSPAPLPVPSVLPVSPQPTNGSCPLPGNPDRSPTHSEAARSKIDIPGPSAAPPLPGKPVKETVRVSIQELDALYRQVEELSTVKYMFGRTTSDLKLVVDQCREWLSEYHKLHRHTMESGRLNANAGGVIGSRCEELQNFIKWTSRQLEGIESTVAKGIEDNQGTMYIMDTMSDALIEQTRHLLLMPFSIITDSLPSMVNKIARDLGKKIDFRISGEDVRIDKRILEELKDPLIHLLRNSIDHGIEIETARSLKGKPAAGSLQLDIRLAADNRVELSLSDDGSGIDVEAVRAKAIAEGIAGKDFLEAQSAQRILDLVFHSGLSTAKTVTELSGRGIGLSVVKENVSALGGEVLLSTQPGRGTTFKILLPVSMSNARGVIVRTSGRMYVVPLQYILRGMSLTREDITALDGKPVFEFEGRTVPVYRLEELLGMPAVASASSGREAVLVLSCADTVFGLHVEEVLWEQDVVVKPLPSPIARVRTIAGATLLGTGELVPVLHIPDMLDATRASEQHQYGRAASEEVETISRLLVVDDSITSRVLLHDILVSSGYQVKTAVDGIDALTHLRESEYDLVVSDVEMPRMNGFELTQTIRKDEKLHELPVVLVTGLESREDRERGFDVGANAYIIKSGFDQSNLLEVIGRLI